ncbi:hypothetical protein CVT24_012149 [Panaeolus cyanescens]|uniref:F-box domain-containing protein n=1 Tax=Panaeolus cyanescens TaxID=181874 RepID=A0A409X4A3_9AGAR|nr:hypothetical protein CVT24_012149 [Panaeolus cyanescens]
MLNSDHRVPTAKNDPEGPVFPFEIFELIIKLWLRGRYSKLNISSLCLVSKSFAKICRPHMFNSVQIYMYKDLNRTKDLAAVINNNPTLATYIHKLEFHERNQREACQPIGADQDGSLDPFLNLPNLQQLKVNGRGGKTYGAMGASLFSFQRVLDQYMASSTLISLDIHSISRLPILEIMGCPNLENLTLYSCDLQSWDQPVHSDVLQRGFKLKSISISSMRHVTLSLLAYCPNLQSIHFGKMGGPDEERQLEDQFPINAMPLKTFKNVTSIESWGPVDWTNFCHLASSAGVKAFPALRRLRLVLFGPTDIMRSSHLLEHIKSLQQLSIQGRGYLDPLRLDLKQFLALSTNTLTNITILWDLNLRTGQDQNLLKILCDALTDISHRNVLRRLSLRLEITARQALPMDFVQWKRLDSLLTGSNGNAFPNLVYVEIRLRFNDVIDGISGSMNSKGEYKTLFEHSLNGLLTHDSIRVIFDLDT